MQLTNEQILNIENRLIENGVKYWDIRVEMLDHIVSDVEENLTESDNFKQAVHNSFVKLGWNGSFEDQTKKHLFSVNKKIRTHFFNKTLDLITNLKSVIIILLFTFLYFQSYKCFDFSIFKKISLTILLLPAIAASFFHYVAFFKKKKSSYIIYSTFYMFFSFLMLNPFYQLLRPDGIIPVSLEIHKVILFLITILNTIFSVSGILVYLKIAKEIQNLKEKLSLC